MPSFTHTETVAASPEAVFAIVDDFSQTPTWLARCTGIDTLSAGPHEVGTRLRYHYRDGRRTGEMDGEVAGYEPDRYLRLAFEDSMMAVTIDFRTQPMGEETSLTHEIDIRTKGLGKLVTPMIKRSLPGQTLDAMTKLKALAETGG